MAKNFTSSPKWCSDKVIACVAPLTYLVQLQDGRIWRRHVDHIVVTENQAGSKHFNKGKARLLWPKL